MSNATHGNDFVVNKWETSARNNTINLVPQFWYYYTQTLQETAKSDALLFVTNLHQSKQFFCEHRQHKNCSLVITMNIKKCSNMNKIYACMTTWRKAILTAFNEFNRSKRVIIRKICSSLKHPGSTSFWTSSPQDCQSDATGPSWIIHILKNGKHLFVGYSSDPYIGWNDCCMLQHPCILVKKLEERQLMLLPSELTDCHHLDAQQDTYDGISLLP